MCVCASWGRQPPIWNHPFRGCPGGCVPGPGDPDGQQTPCRGRRCALTLVLSSFWPGLSSRGYPTAPMLSGARVLPSPEPGHSAVPATTPSAGGRFGFLRGRLIGAENKAPFGLRGFCSSPTRRSRPETCSAPKRGFLLRRINSGPSCASPACRRTPASPTRLRRLEEGPD